MIGGGILKQKGYILFGTKPLLEFGIHIGHLFKDSQFYSRWFLKGLGKFFFVVKYFVKNIISKYLVNNSINVSFLKKANRRNLSVKNLIFPIFFINLAKSLLGIRSLIYVAQYTGFTFGRGWFVCHNQLFIPFTLRYALLLGMGYSVFDWIAGCLTNFKKIFKLFFVLYREFINGMVLEKKHLIFIYRLLGFNLTGFWVPSFLFLPRMLESRIANWEGGCLFIKSIGIIDSNVLSGDTTLPLASNDDSFLSVNFYFFMLSFHILKYLFLFIKKWRTSIKKMSKRRYFWILNYFTFFYRNSGYKSWRKMFYKFYVQIYKKPFFLKDYNQIFPKLIPFGSLRFGINTSVFDSSIIDYRLKSFSKLNV